MTELTVSWLWLLLRGSNNHDLQKAHTEKRLCNEILSLVMRGEIHRLGLDSNSSTTIGWIDMKLCTDVCGPQRREPVDFGALLTFPLAPPWVCVKYLYKC